MPIDDFEPVYSAARKRARTSGGTSQYDIASTRFIDELKGALVACGWTENDYIYPSGAPQFPFGANYVTPGPPPDGGKVFVTCERGPLLKFDGVNYVPYNPYTEQVAPGGTCVFFEYGTSGEATLNNLATAISAGNYSASWSAPRLNIVGKFPGTILNHPQCLPDARWGTPGIITGGGYSLLSPGPGTTLIAQITADGGNQSVYGAMDGRVKVKISSNDFSGFGEWYTDVHPGYDTEPIKDLVILANPHGFCYFDPDKDNHFTKNTSFLVAAIEIPVEFYDTPAAMVLAPGVFRATTSSWNRCACVLGAGMNIWEDGAFPRLVFARSPGTTALTTLAGVPYLQGAYVAFGAYREDQYKVVGRMWDCIITSEYVPWRGSLILESEDGPMRFEVVSNQDGSDLKTRSSLLWRYE